MKRKDEDRPSRSTGGVAVEPEREKTLEAFIGQLHAEGVEAGRQEAERMRQAAAKEAEAVIAKARESARHLIQQAEVKGQALLAESRGEIALAMRDAELELRAKLSRALTSLLTEGLERELSDPRLLRELLREVVVAYARADGSGSRLEVHVRPELAQELASALPGRLGRELGEAKEGYDLRADLRAAGFEYRIHDGRVEVTPESVAELLAELVTPRLRALLQEAAREQSTPVEAGTPDDAGTWIGPAARAAAGR